MLSPRFTRIAYALCAILFAAIIVRAFLNVKGTDGLVATVSQEEVERFARQELDALQSRSFSEDLELCGIIFETSDGELGVSRPLPGDEASCNIAYFDGPGMVPVASFHTHGKHSDQYDGEVPSLVDLQSDIESGMDGYIATPGGRFWHIDHASQRARMVCGEGCMTQDPSYVSCSADHIQQSYTVPELAERFSTPRPFC